MPSAIDPGQIPGVGLDPDLVELNATVIASSGRAVRDQGSAVHLRWQAMAGVYSAPESLTLLGLMEPVSSQATTVGDNLEAVAAALKEFAEAARPIKTALDALRVEAQAFVDGTVATGVRVQETNPAWLREAHVRARTGRTGPTPGPDGVTPPDPPRTIEVLKPWHEDQGAVDRNNGFLAAVGAQQVLLWEAERTCANKIRALLGADPLRAAQSADDALGYGMDDIPRSADTPWGSPVTRTEACADAAVRFVFRDVLFEGVVIGGLGGTLEGLGSLVLGYDPATGRFFQAEAYGAAFGGAAQLALGVVISTSPMLKLLFDANDDARTLTGTDLLPDEVLAFKEQLDQTGRNVGESLIAWDKWADDPGTALGETLFTVATILVPGGAARSAVTSGGAAAEVFGRAARFAREFDPGTRAVDGAARLGGFAVRRLGDVLGGGDLARRIDALRAAPIEVLRSPDAATALRELIDARGIPAERISLNTVDGRPVIDGPGVRVELPAGSFDAPHVTAGDAPPRVVPTGGDANVPPHTGLPAPPAHAGADAASIPDLSRIDVEYRLADGSVDPTRIDEWAAAVSAEYPNLSASEVKGVYDYTTNSGYEDMNRYLRALSDPDVARIPDLEARIDAATKALAKLPTEPGRTYRGLAMTPELLDRFQPGGRWRDDSFLSTSRDRAVADRFAREAMPGYQEAGIAIIDGVTGADISRLSRFQHEQELVFQRGTEFEVVSKTRDNSGVWLIHLRETVNGELK